MCGEEVHIDCVGELATLDAAALTVDNLFDAYIEGLLPGVSAVVLDAIGGE